MSRQYDDQNNQEAFVPVTSGKIIWFNKKSEELHQRAQSSKSPILQPRYKKTGIFLLMIAFIIISGINTPITRGTGLIGALICFFAICYHFFIEADVTPIDEKEDDDRMFSYSKALRGHPASRTIYGLDGNDIHNT